MGMTDSDQDRGELAARYLDLLPYPPYPLQEDALLGWFTTSQGIMVSAPTGTGKTLIAEAALFEALSSKEGSTAYYTTPLIALTEQKFHEFQELAVRWGFSADKIGLVTGHRKVNPDAPVLVVVAEILLNRLLHPEAFDFSKVSAVVMDEFHSFNDIERGIVWELSLSLLPKTVRLMLLSATIGNAAEFLVWLSRSHGRALQLFQGNERKIPLSYHWVGDRLLNEQMEEMAVGDEMQRKLPALLFCFNRNECWDVAEQLKGKSLLKEGQQKRLTEIVLQSDWSQGAGPKLKPLLLRGVGIHHAGIMPKYRRLIESLFQKKLLSVVVCTETLAAGINLPARSVVLTTLVKGPSGKRKLIDPSSAHQMFGRAGRPQFDTQGHIFVLAHEDDVQLLRWKERYDSIPEDTKDPLLIRAKKKLKKKMPQRKTDEVYWNEVQFQKLIASPPGKLSSRGYLPWRLLAYLLKISPHVAILRNTVRKRLLDPIQLEHGERELTQMLLTLWAGGYITLVPDPPAPVIESAGVLPATTPSAGPANEPPSETPPQPEAPAGTFGALLHAARSTPPKPDKKKGTKSDGDDSLPRRISEKEKLQLQNKSPGSAKPALEHENRYEPQQAHATPLLDRLLIFRSVNPIYGSFLLNHLGIASREERVQALESVLELPTSMWRDVKVPPLEELPPGPLAMTRLDQELLNRGLVTPAQLKFGSADDEQNRDAAKTSQKPFEERFLWKPCLAEKLQLLFRSEYPGVADVRISPVWVAGNLLRFQGDFNKYVTSQQLVKQEGAIFRHLLRLILLCGEFLQLTPTDGDPREWQDDLRSLADMLTESCRAVDPASTDEIMEMVKAVDIVVSEEAIPVNGTSTVSDNREIR
ncbi:MAG: DEAD/DEAH box helicase [Planctomycetaceae bacterium]